MAARFRIGDKEQHLTGLSDMNDGRGMIVAHDVLGGQFAWLPSSAGEPTIWYFAPDTLRGEDCERGYGDWLAAMIGVGRRLHPEPATRSLSLFFNLEAFGVLLC